MVKDINKYKLFMLDGDDKLTIFVALGSNLPVKKVNYSRKFNQEYMEYYNKNFPYERFKFFLKVQLDKVINERFN